jgi:hypothetical protein
VAIAAAMGLLGHLHFERLDPALQLRERRVERISFIDEAAELLIQFRRNEIPGRHDLDPFLFALGDVCPNGVATRNEFVPAVFRRLELAG